MDISHPLSAVTSTATARVLEVLAGTTRPLAGREIHRIAEQSSVATVWRILRRLSEQGIVTADHRGTAVYYTANRDHLAWSAIEALVRIRAELIARLTEVIGGWAIRPLYSSLFGSAARGDGNAESDIDLLFVLPDSVGQNEAATWDDQISRLRQAVYGWTGNDCQTFQVDRARLLEHVDARDPLVDAWLRDGIRLTGTPLADLIGARLRLPVA